MIRCLYNLGSDDPTNWAEIFNTLQYLECEHVTPQPAVPGSPSFNPCFPGSGLRSQGEFTGQCNQLGLGAVGATGHLPSLCVLVSFSVHSPDPPGRKHEVKQPPYFRVSCMMLSAEWVEHLCYLAPLRKIPERTLIGPAGARGPYPGQPAMARKVQSEPQAWRKKRSSPGRKKGDTHMSHTHAHTHILRSCWGTSVCFNPSPPQLQPPST